MTNIFLSRYRQDPQGATRSESMHRAEESSKDTYILTNSNHGCPLRAVVDKNTKSTTKHACFFHRVKHRGIAPPSKLPTSCSNSASPPRNITCTGQLHIQLPRTLSPPLLIISRRTIRARSATQQVFISVCNENATIRHRLVFEDNGLQGFEYSYGRCAHV